MAIYENSHQLEDFLDDPPYPQGFWVSVKTATFSSLT